MALVLLARPAETRHQVSLGFYSQAPKLGGQPDCSSLDEAEGELGETRILSPGAASWDVRNAVQLH